MTATEVGVTPPHVICTEVAAGREADASATANWRGTERGAEATSRGLFTAMVRLAEPMAPERASRAACTGAHDSGGGGVWWRTAKVGARGRRKGVRRAEGEGHER